MSTVAEKLNYTEYYEYKESSEASDVPLFVAANALKRASMIILHGEDNTVTCFDMRKLKKQSKVPVKVIRAMIKNTVGDLVDDPQKMFVLDSGLGEIAKDVDEHGNSNRPEYFFVTKKNGYVEVDTYNEKKKRSNHNNLGKNMLKAYFGPNFYTEENGGIYRNHLTIAAKQSGPVTQSLDVAA